jgi:hypothetical protein
MIGSSPVKAIGAPGANGIDWSTWLSIDRCCGGCVNMAFSLQGENCICVWDNGSVDLAPATRGGTYSGAAGAGTARTADNFVIRSCDPVEICFIEAYVWTNCVPPIGFIEIYENECDHPALAAPVRTAAVTRVIDTLQTATINGVAYHLYKLQATNPHLALAGGKDYWLSAGVQPTGSLNGQSLFAYVSPNCRTCAVKISPGDTRAITPVPDDQWTPGTRDYAFRIAVRETPLLMIDNQIPAFPSCIADADRNGSVSIDDIFIFLNAWFTGCP